MEQHKNEPSIFLGALTGYAVATVIGALITIWLFINTGRATATGGLKLLTGAGVLGVYLGYAVTVSRRKAQGLIGPYDEWSQFFGSWMLFALAMIVIAGSFGIAVLIKLLFDAVAGQQG